MLSTGTHTFSLEFRFQASEFGSVIVAKGRKTLTVQSDRSNLLSFSESDYSYPDHDEDGVSNLRELDRGWSLADKNDPEFIPEMTRVSGGSFQMGSPESEEGRNDDERLHGVQVKDFVIGKYEITRGEFRRFTDTTRYQTDAEKNSGESDGCYVDKGDDGFGYLTGTSWRDPRFTQTDEHAVVCISWYDATAYVKSLCSETGQDYRLPTEAEWEYAARAGVSTTYSFGSDSSLLCTVGNVADREMESEYQDFTIAQCRDGYIYTAPVGQFNPNAQGELYDFTGNAWEWSCSGYRADYSGAEQVCLEASDGAEHVLRGGAWINRPTKLRSAFRLSGNPVERGSFFGFRVARTIF